MPQGLPRRVRLPGQRRTAMFASALALLPPLLAAESGPGLDVSPLVLWTVVGAVVLVLLILFVLEVVLGWRYIPNNRVGIIEKIWSAKGSVPEGRIIALNG